ncbi:ribosomal protein S18 acetylase RimI-like enzyme [Anaerosolibacter carboniphilus]|uniref:Ribosomal protein S18 acetylase RimI-like enzyme n=1 Tax=Anaerosolibacter carboniphilus TaxID=1417629 RepID=A0A841L0P1_9FIRM|nr:GNAT family N-acetyltransferase [Anaerosolibacter carboniphilus]MBB6218148.1 ribosomal protein S18 acetylase RimI-like enzyme [Anaerosolibacter carboniphilus]
MSIKFCNYINQHGFTDDFLKVYDFLKRINQENVTTPNFLWGRWEWMFSLPYLNKSFLNRIGMWKDDEKIVALATYETDIDEAYICVDKDYHFLKEDILNYVQHHFSGEHKVLIDDNDHGFQRIAIAHGYRPTQSKQCTARIDIDDNISYQLPQGFRVVSLAERFDLYEYSKVLWRGFNHDGEPPKTGEHMLDIKNQFAGPHVNLEHKIAVVAPNGEFVSYCGMWYERNTDYALVEPVATDPQYRMMGLGKAAVLEAVMRCGKLGAKRAYVGSSQQFYYNIGFYPVSTETFWCRK